MRIGVPSGVGDVYWVLTKLQAFKVARGIDHVTLCVQKSQHTRALAWGQMVDFVEAIEEYPFRPNDEARTTGFSTAPVRMRRHERREFGLQEPPPLDAVMWPNAIIDRGVHIREWMPELELDLSFPVRTVPAPGGRVVVYVSSVGANQAWLPAAGPWYWRRLIEALAVETGEVPVLIGAPWDLEFREQIDVPLDDRCGRTTLPEVAGILQSASVVVGLICGMTILANHFRTPTVALRADKHTEAFARAWVADDAPYVSIPNSQLPPPEKLAARVASMRRPT